MVLDCVQEARGDSLMADVHRSRLTFPPTAEMLMGTRTGMKQKKQPMKTFLVSI